jgi:hypothetical protein
MIDAMERNSRMMELSPAKSDGPMFDFDTLEEKETLFSSGNSKLEQKALCELAVVTERVRRIESRSPRRRLDDEEPRGKRVGSRSPRKELDDDE